MMIQFKIIAYHSWEF